MQHLQTVKRGQAAPHSTLESSRLFSSHDNAPYMPLWSRCPKQYPPYLLFSNVPNNPVSGTFGLKPRKSAVKARSFHPHQAKSKVFTQLPRGPIQPCPTHLSNEWHLLCPPIRRPLGLHFPKFLWRFSQFPPSNCTVITVRCHLLWENFSDHLIFQIALFTPILLTWYI